MGRVLVRRDKEAREQRLQVIASLYVQGLTLFAISKRVNVTPGQLTYDMKVLVKRWQESALSDIQHLKLKELVKIDELERVYWDAWERSKAERTTSSTKKKERQQTEPDTNQQPVGFKPNKRGQKGPPVNVANIEAMLRKEENFGDPRFLAGIQWCIDTRCQIWGIYGPTKIAPTNPAGDREYGEESEDRRFERLLELLNTGRTRFLSQTDTGTQLLAEEAGRGEVAEEFRDASLGDSGTDETVSG